MIQIGVDAMAHHKLNTGFFYRGRIAFEERTAPQDTARIFEATDLITGWPLGTVGFDPELPLGTRENPLVIAGETLYGFRNLMNVLEGLMTRNDEIFISRCGVDFRFTGYPSELRIAPKPHMHYRNSGFILTQLLVALQ
jgi:hypothetical protein